MSRLSVCRVAVGLLFASSISASVAAQPAEPEPQPEAKPEPGPTTLPPQYYVDSEEEAPPAAPQPLQPPPGPQQPEGAIHVYEPPPPGYAVYEPPPPPAPRHLAPEYSLWVGARLGFFHPFGNAWGECTVVDRSGICLASEGAAWQDYASSGPMGELDIGARLGRRHVLFLAWEHAKLGNGSIDLPGAGAQQSGETDFFGVGLRFSSNPSAVGLLVEIMVGGRRFRTTWEDGSELRLENAPFESRIGIGADIRLSRLVSLSPMFTLGGGQFGDVTFYDAATDTETEPDDLPASHAWVTLQMGVHFDLFGSKN